MFKGFTVFRYQGLEGLREWLTTLRPSLASTLNLVVSAVFLYINIYPRRFLVEAFTSGEASRKKPLVQLLDQYIVHFSYPFSGTVAVLYYQFYGKSIWNCLDAEVLRPAYSGPRMKLQFVLSLSAYILSFACCYADFLLIAYQKESVTLLIKLLSTAYYYLLFNSLYLGLLIAHYLHYGVYFRLRRVVVVLRKNSSEVLPQPRQNSQISELSLSSPEEAVKLVQALAAASNIGSRMYSLPICIFLLATLTDVVVCLTTVSLEFSLSLCLYIGITFSYLAYLAYLNQQIRSCLKVISNVYGENEQVNLGAAADDSDNDNEQQQQTENHWIVAASELESVYGDRLGVNIFRLFTLDYRFVCQFTLFVVNFSILIAQTNQL